jgi:hypothetical protein
MIFFLLVSTTVFDIVGGAVVMRDAAVFLLRGVVPPPPPSSSSPIRNYFSDSWIHRGGKVPKNSERKQRSVPLRSPPLCGGRCRIVFMYRALKQKSWLFMGLNCCTAPYGGAGGGGTNPGINAECCLLMQFGGPFPPNCINKVIIGLINVVSTFSHLFLFQ